MIIGIFYSFQGSKQFLRDVSCFLWDGKSLIIENSEFSANL